MYKPAFEYSGNDNPGWALKGACRDNIELFDALIDGSRDKAMVEHAKAICKSSCIVREACLNDALGTQDKRGVRAGYTGKEIASLALRRAS